jgi:hypothetical protein
MPAAGPACAVDPVLGVFGMVGITVTWCVGVGTGAARFWQGFTCGCPVEEGFGGLFHGCGVVIGHGVQPTARDRWTGGLLGADPGAFLPWG